MTEIGGPKRMAMELDTAIADIKVQLDHATTAQERRDLNSLLQRNLSMLRWCKTRAGYHSKRSSPE